MKIFKRLAIIFCAAFLALSSTGVWGMWVYRDDLQPTSTNATLGIFAPNYPEVGQSHNVLIQALLNGNDKTDGLNQSGSKINQVIEARDDGGWLNWGRIQEGRNTIGSMASLFEEDMEKFGAAVENLAFLIYFPNGNTSTEYKIYTWSTENGGLPLKLNGTRVQSSDIEMANWRTGSNILNYKYYPETAPTKTVWVGPVYETTVVKVNGVWQQQGMTIEGYAQACFYTENNNNNMHNSKLLSIYPPSFTTVKPE